MKFGSKQITLLVLTIIFLLGLSLRVFKLSTAPVSLWVDEAAIGYNAYSILKTGKDEFGTPFPLVFRSVGDYKAPLLVYTIIPAIAIFGLNEFGLRITVALVGALTIIVVFYLVNLLMKNEKIALLTSFLLAISPWHIKFSRATFEATLALFLVLLGTVFFLKAVKNGRGLWVSSIFFALSLYAYHAERVFVPLLVVGLGLIYKSELLQKKKAGLIAIMFGFLMVLPLIFVLLTPAGKERANMTFLAKDFEISRFLHTKEEVLNFPANLLDNNALLVFNFWAKRYLGYFDLSYLFIDGMDFTMPKAPDIGLLYLFELPFFLTGLFLVVFRGQLVDARVRALIILWIILGPLAASLANNPQHPLRFLVMIPIPQLLAGVGIWFFYRKIHSPTFKKVFVTGFASVAVFSVAYFVDLYFLQYKMTSSEYLMDGWKEAANFALQNRDNYTEIVVDPRFGTQGPYTVSSPYIYILFYGKIDPRSFQNDPRRREAWDSTNFKNFTFREIDWRSGYDKDKKTTLFIGSEWILPAQEKEITKRFYLVTGKEILRAAIPE